jgi:glutaredoxin
MTKAWLSQRGVPFVEANISVDDSARQNLLDMGYRTTPVVTIGKDVIVGYSTAKLQASLDSYSY